MLNSHFCDLNQLVNCSYVACNSFIKANVPHYITSEPRVTAEHLGTSDQNLHHFIAGVLPASLFLSVHFFWYSYEYHLSSSTPPSILPCGQALWIKTLTTPTIHSSVTMAARRDREHVRVQNGVLTEDGMTSRRQGDQASRVTCLI